MKYARTKSGLPPLSLADAARITSIRCDAVRSLEDALNEMEESFEGSDLLAHYNEADGSWNAEIQPLIDHYHGLQNAYLELTGGHFERSHDAVRWIEPQLAAAAKARKKGNFRYGQDDPAEHLGETPRNSAIFW